MKRSFTMKQAADVTHMIYKMDEETNSKSSIFTRLNPAKREHLNPLSVYSRMIICDQNERLHDQRKFSNPFINFKIEIKNNPVKKRKLDDSSPDDGYVSSKKSFNPRTVSPDLGCFMDDCSPPTRQDSVSPFEFTKSALNKTDIIRTEIKEPVSSRLLSEHVDYGSSTEPGASKGEAPQSFKCEKVVLNLAPAFDCDVDDILCLNPVGTNSAGGFSENVERCKSPSRNLVQNKPLLIPTVAHRRDGKVEEGREELKKEMYLKLKDGEEDEGCAFIPCVNDIKIGENPPQARYPQLPTATSIPLHRIGEAEGPQDECRPESSSGRAASSGQRISISVSDLESVNLHLGSLEGDDEEMWNIGPPLFESSVLHSITVKLNAGSEQSRHMTEEAQGGVIEPVPEFHTTPTGEEATSDTSYETTLPLQVQVKSVVVAVSQHTTTTTTTSSKPAPPPLPEQKARPTKPNPDENRVSQSGKCVSSSWSQRPLVYDREEDWEREKRLYVHSVTRHMKEKPGADQDVMTELLNLMSHVADQTPGTNGNQWQHPSDLTRRNYQRRFGNMKSKMALHEWQAKNCATHKRFAKIPKIFERSYFP